MILIALGANLASRYGSPLETLQAVLPALEKRDMRIIAVSRIWLTAPVPVSDQPDYHNAVIAVETTRTPQELLAMLQDIEHEFGRVRVRRNEARVLDLDLLAYHDDQINQTTLTVPHPRLHERAFVLLPLQDIAKNWTHPVSRKPLSDMIRNLPPGQLAHAIVEALR